MKDDAMVQRELAALDFATSWSLRSEWVESGSGKHFRGSESLVQGHQGGTVEFVKVQTQFFAVVVDKDFVPLQQENKSAEEFMQVLWM